MTNDFEKDLTNAKFHHLTDELHGALKDIL